MGKASDFRQKEVINISDGRRLGFVYDVEINLISGMLEAIVLPGQGKVLGLFGKDEELLIPWDKIRKVGEDIILVDIQSDNL